MLPAKKPDSMSAKCTGSSDHDSCTQGSRKTGSSVVVLPSEYQKQSVAMRSRWYRPKPPPSSRSSSTVEAMATVEAPLSQLGPVSSSVVRSVDAHDFM